MKEKKLQECTDNLSDSYNDFRNCKSISDLVSNYFLHQFSVFDGFRYVLITVYPPNLSNYESECTYSFYGFSFFESLHDAMLSNYISGLSFIVVDLCSNVIYESL